MGIIYRTKVTTSDSFRDLFKRQKYEELVLRILNKSEKLISNVPLVPEVEQSHGECDFKDQIGTKFEAKMLLDKKQGALIGDRKNELSKWFEVMIDETSEFSESIKRKDLSFVSSTRLYKLMNNLLGHVETDEVAVLFIPYPVVHEYRGGFFLQLATDFLQAVYNRLVEENVFSCQEVYFIYPSMEPDYVVLRNAQTRGREFINIPEMSNYIDYETVPIVE